MKRIMAGLVSLAVATLVQASVIGGVEMLPVDIDIANKERLQRGARIFMNYCSGCHSLRYLRYNRMAKDLGLTTFDGALDEDLLKNNLIFTKAPIYNPLEIAMPETEARQWFGVNPPDLTLIARKRGAEWLYTYLESFYEDKSRPFGSNNLLIPGVAMPDVLAPLTGRVIKIKPDNAGDDSLPPHLMRMGDGQMSPQEFDEEMQDLVTFLVYVGEPAKLVRYRIGGFVIAFLFVFFVVAYRLKKNYWKDMA